VYDHITVDQVSQERDEPVDVIRKRVATIAKARDMDIGCPALRRILDPEFALNLDQVKQMFGDSKLPTDPLEEL